MKTATHTESATVNGLAQPPAVRQIAAPTRFDPTDEQMEILRTQI